MIKWKKMTVGDLCDTISDTYHGEDEKVVLINTSDVLEGKVLNRQAVVNKNLKGQFKKTFREMISCIRKLDQQTNDMRLWILKIQKIILHQQS